MADKYIEAQQAQIGPAESMPENVAESAEAVPEDLLDRRQAAMGTRRRPGGPVLEITAETAEAVAESLPEQPETDCEPPQPETGR
jgi:hypothetical protein